MRISDWSSDVCSSDLPDRAQGSQWHQPRTRLRHRARARSRAGARLEHRVHRSPAKAGVQSKESGACCPGLPLSRENKRPSSAKDQTYRANTHSINVTHRLHSTERDAQTREVTEVP